MKRVIEYLVSKNYLRQEHFNTWENLKSLHILTPGEAQQMIQFKRKERRAILNLQKDYGLPQTGIIDNGVREIIFGSICGTADVDDEDSYEEKKTIIFNQVHRFLGEETQAYTVQGTTWKHKNMGIFKFYSFSTKYNHENKYNRCSHSYLSFSTTMAKYIIGVVLFYERCTLSRVVR